MPNYAHALVRARKQLPHHLPEAQVMKSLADGTHEAILRAHFGEGYDDIAAAAKSVAAKLSGPKKRRVFVLPGIMGSTIGEPKGNENHVKWLDPLEMAEGNLLKLAYNIKPFAGTSVGPLTPIYVPLKLRLQLSGHDVELCHYDWRLSMADIANKLVAQIKADKASKVTLVCHSMGGLVARALLKADAAVNAKVELVVQLGTPNLGALAVVQAVRGSFWLARLASTLDVKHTPEDYGRFCATFPGIYVLMPPAIKSPFSLNVRQRSLWPKAGVQPEDALLASNGVTQDNLLAPDGRFHLIASGNFLTAIDVRVKGDQFEYDYAYAGDDTVPHSSSNMPGLDKVWFVDEIDHSSLCMAPPSCDAAAALLDGGSPSLPTVFKPKKAGVIKTETDASLMKTALEINRGEQDVIHLLDSARSLTAKMAGNVHDPLPSVLKKAGSWLKKHL